MHDRFVMGMLPGPEKLFSRELNTLTLAKAVEQAGNLRAARVGTARFCFYIRQWSAGVQDLKVAK